MIRRYRRFLVPNIALLILILFLAGMVSLFVLKLSKVDADTARSALSTIALVESTVLVLTLAGLALVSNFFTIHSARLDKFRPQLSQILRETGTRALLKDIVKAYEKAYKEHRSQSMPLPPYYKYPRIKHLSDAEVMSYLPALAAYADCLAGDDPTTLDSRGRELAANSMLLFRISCGVLLADACALRMAKDDKTAMPSESLRDLDQTEGIVMSTNNVYDTRLAARRGAIIFCFLTLGATVLSLTTLSILSSANFNRVFYAMTAFWIIPIALFAGYYIDQFLKRYFEV